MALENSAALLKEARRKGYCIGAFNVVDYLTMQAVIATAADEKAPVIVQTSPAVVKRYGAPTLVRMATWLVECFPTPVGLHLDHGVDLSMIQACIAAGYTSVMIDASHKPFAENVAQTRRVVEIAHAHGVAVEAEIGIVAGVEDDLVVSQDQAMYSTPEEAIAFQEQSGCDFLAAAIGTAHGFYVSAPRLNIDTLVTLRAHTSFPLVVHGGSGLSFKTLRQLVQAGASKLNISTQLKKTYLDSLKNFLDEHLADYNPLKMFAFASGELAAVVTSYLQVLGASGQVKVKG